MKLMNQIVRAVRQEAREILENAIEVLTGREASDRRKEWQ